jgi:hypothetical protein
MIHSMTGYAAASRDLGSAVLNFEIKSVNSRYLDIGFRIGEDLRFLEMALREKITERVGRGKIEVRGYLQSQAGQAGRRGGRCRMRQCLPNWAACRTRYAKRIAAGRAPVRGRSIALAGRAGRRP